MQRVIYLLILGLSLTKSYSQANVKEITHYLFPEFAQGTVLMKSGVKNEASLNYNLLTEEMIFDNKGKKLAIGGAELELVDTVYIKDRKFFTINNKFVELLYHSKSDLYAEHKCSMKEPGKPSGYGGTSETTAATSYSSIYSGGIVYDLKLPDGYITKPYSYYWLKKNGELNKVVNIRQVMKLYGDKEELFKAYVKKQNVKFENQESIIQLVKYLETNN